MRPALIAVLLGTLAVLPARAQQFDSREAIALNNQIAELRRDLQVLREQIGRGGGAGYGESSSSLGGYRAAPPPSGGGGSSELAAQLLERVSQLEDEVRRLRGRVDESDNARQRQGEELGKQIGDLNFKVDGLAGGGARPPAGPPAAPPAAPPPPVPPAPPAGPPRRTPELALQEGNAALARRDYAAAETLAREALAAPHSPRANDASFLLAQALAGKKDWAKAAVAYDDTYERAKTGPRAPDSLLGLSIALSYLGEKKAACQTLDRLRAEFPVPRADLRDPIAATRQHAGCR